jgi:nucleoid DNA-binding protein
MNKISNSQLISDVADKTGLTKKDVKAVISALGDTIVAHTAN